MCTQCHTFDAVRDEDQNPFMTNKTFKIVHCKIMTVNWLDDDNVSVLDVLLNTDHILHYMLYTQQICQQCLKLKAINS